jgi:hypothetical protein
VPNKRSSLEFINESPGGINHTVKAFTNVIIEISEPFCEKEIITYSHKKHCTKRASCSKDKPSFNDECRSPLREYNKNLANVNFSRTSENHEKLVTSKRKYKTKENRLKSQFQRHEGNQLELLHISNPQKSYRIFNSPKKTADTTLITADFYDHFKNILHVMIKWITRQTCQTYLNYQDIKS